jgi:hypothetical protein
MAAAALFAACKAGDAACVRAELARPGAAALVNAKDVAYVRAPPALSRMRCAEPLFSQFGSTPLHYAAAGGHADVAKALLEWGADARATDAVRLRHAACDSGAMQLRRACAFPRHTAADAWRFQGGWTALHWTAERGHSAVASQLLSAGADARAANRVGVTPLHSAAEKNAGPVAALLLRAGADPRAANAVGDTPLHWCAADRVKAAAFKAAELTRRFPRAPVQGCREGPRRAGGDAACCGRAAVAGQQVRVHAAARRCCGRPRARCARAPRRRR